MEVNLTNLEYALKRNYPISEVTDQMYTATPILSMLKREVPDDIRGSGSALTAYVPIRLSFNASAGANATGAVLPVGRAPTGVQLQIPMKKVCATLEFDGESMAAVQKNSFVSDVADKMQGLKDGCSLYLDRCFTNGNGRGMLARTSSAGGGATSTVDVEFPGTQYLYKGMPIQTFSAETGGTMAADEDISHGLVESTSYTILSVDSATAFTLGNAANTAAHATEKWHDEHYIVRFGAQDSEPMGFRGIFDSYADRATSQWFQNTNVIQTIYGLDRATYPQLDCTMSQAAGVNRPVTEKLIGTALDKVTANTATNSSNPNRLIVSNPAVCNRYADQLTPDRRFTQDTVKLTGGYEAVYFQYGSRKIPWITTNYALPNSLLVLDLRFLFIYEAGMYKWVEATTGSMFDIKTDAVGRYHIYIASMYNFVNLGCRGFKHQLCIRDISET